MKKLLVATFVALLLAGCGEDSKKPRGDSPESNQSSAETTPVKPTAVAKIDLDDETLNRIIAEAIDRSTLQRRGEEGEKLYYNVVNENGVLVEYLHDGTEKRRATFKDGERVEDGRDSSYLRDSNGS